MKIRNILSSLIIGTIVTTSIPALANTSKVKSEKTKVVKQKVQVKKTVKVQNSKKTSKIQVTKSAKNNPNNIKKTNFKSKTVRKQVLSASGPLRPSNSQVIYSIMDLKTGKYLEQNNINAVHSLASLTKLMSSYVFLKQTHNMNNCSIQITADDKDTLKNTRSHMRRDVDIPCDTALEATLSLSDNYAASAISRSVNNLSKSQFIKLMNEQSKSWGMKNTYFADPAGLNPANKSTAEDLNIFLRKIRWVQEYDLLKDFSTQKEVNIDTTGKARIYRNTNKLIREDVFDAELSKTGFINESGYNLVFIPKNCTGDTQIGLVIMGERSSYSRSNLATKLLKKYNCS